MLDLDIDFDLSRSNELLSILSYLPKIGPVLEMLFEVQEAYEEVVLEEFDRNSTGGGDWEPIAWETAQRKGHTDILVDSYAMRQGLEGGIGLVATLRAGGGFEVQMGFTNKSRHPDAGMTIADLAAIHHLGLGNVPERRILLPPNMKGARKMMNSMTKLAAKVMNK